MKKNKDIIIFIILILIGILLTYLFYNQAIGNFESDLSIQLSDNASEYSVTKIVYSFIINYLGGKIGIAVFLALVSITSIILTKEILKEYDESSSEFSQWIYAILLNFCIAIYFPLVHKMLYIGVQTGNVWHNSTYICMKPLGLLAVILYLKLQKQYLQKIEIKYYILFCLTLILINAVKPSFIVTFAPAMLIYLIIDFFKNIKDRNKVRNIIIFGFAVLISLPILIYQNTVLFGTASENKIIIGCMSILKLYHKYPLISLIQSSAFPLFILITNWKTIIQNRKYSFILTMNVFGLAEYLFLQETGERFLHANFSWQYYFTLAIAFIFSVIIMNNRRKEEKDDNKIYYIICYILLGLHIISGMIYFARLLMGYIYY